MKCPKCGYVGFEETARCRHCGYDFTFAAAAAAGPVPPFDPQPPLPDFVDKVLGARQMTPPATDRPGFLDLPALDAEIETTVAPPRPSVQELFADPAPPPARPPLAVRRGPDRPRSRPATHVVRRSAGGLLDVPLSADPPAEATQAVIGPGSLLARTAAGIIDVALLGGIAAAVVYFTLRLTGLTMEQVAILPIVPLSAFLLGLVLSYLIAFTCCGGQTLGKMAFGLRVVADDGAVPPGTAVLRALVTVAGVAMAGLGVLPAIFDGQRRAVHDRVTGTRVVRT